MSRWVYARRAVQGDPRRIAETLHRATRELLQAASGSEPTAPAGDGSFTMTLHNHRLVDASKTVRVHIGEVVARDGWSKIPIRWEAEPGRHLFPRFSGGIELEEEARARVGLSIVGEYRPPAGPLGTLADAAGLLEVAEATIRELVDALAARLAEIVAGDGALPEPLEPAGALRVADIMTTDPLTFGEDTSLRVAALVLLHKGIAGAPVVDAKGALIGVLSERDLLDKVAADPTGIGRKAATALRRRDAGTVGEACSRPALTTDADATVREAAAEMARRDVSRLVVLDGAKVVGIVTRHDALKALVRADEEIAATCRQRIAALGLDHVEVDVAFGEVVLRGSVDLRSQVGEVVAAVNDVDGVLTVEEHLTYVVNDLVPPTIVA